RNDNVFDIQSSASRFIQDQAGEFISSIIAQDLIYDHLDSRLEPTDGFYLSFGTDFAGVGGDIRYLRLRTRNAIYFPIAPPEWVFSLRGEAGYIKGLGETFGTGTPDQTVRINDRFFPGGDNFRGF